MDFKTVLVLIIPSVVAIFATIFRMYLDYKKSKEPPKDEVWEAAIKLMCSCGSTGFVNADEFAELYEDLSTFRKMNYKMEGQTLQGIRLEKKRLLKTITPKNDTPDIQ